MEFVVPEYNRLPLSREPLFIHQSPSHPFQFMFVDVALSTPFLPRRSGLCFDTLPGT